MHKSEQRAPGALPSVLILALLFLLVESVGHHAFAQSARIIENKKAAAQSRAQQQLIPGASNIRKGETLGIYAAWTGISVRQLMISARIKSPADFREGMVLHLMLSPEQWMRVHAARSATRAEFNGLKPLSRLSRPEVPTAPPRPETRFLIHTVQNGENASTIARFYGVDLKTIREANGGKNLSVILPGQDLYIPNFLATTPPKQAIPMGTDSGVQRSRTLRKVRAPKKLQTPNSSSQ